MITAVRGPPRWRQYPGQADRRGSGRHGGHHCPERDEGHHQSEQESMQYVAQLVGGCVVRMAGRCVQAHAGGRGFAEPGRSGGDAVDADSGVGLGHDVQSATRVGVSSRRSVLSASWDVSDVGWGTQTGGGSGARVRGEPVVCCASGGGPPRSRRAGAGVPVGRAAAGTDVRAVCRVRPTARACRRCGPRSRRAASCGRHRRVHAPVFLKTHFGEEVEDQDWLLGEFTRRRGGKPCHGREATS